jgi:hypothetical protein
VLPQTRQGDGLRGSELLYARFCPAASRVPRKSYPRGSELLDDQMDGSLSPDKSPARQLPNATHASPMPPHRPTTPGFANNSSYRSPSVMREPNHAEEGAGDMQPDLDYTAHVSIEPSSPGRAPSLETSFSTPGPRRVQTPPPDRLDAIRQKAQGQEVRGSPHHHTRIFINDSTRHHCSPPRCLYTNLYVAPGNVAIPSHCNEMSSHHLSRPGLRGGNEGCFWRPVASCSHSSKQLTCPIPNVASMQLLDMFIHVSHCPGIRTFSSLVLEATSLVPVAVLHESKISCARHCGTGTGI